MGNGGTVPSKDLVDEMSLVYLDLARHQQRINSLVQGNPLTSPGSQALCKQRLSQLLKPKGMGRRSHLAGLQTSKSNPYQPSPRNKCTINFLHVWHRYRSDLFPGQDSP